jgi:hypothetical protein
MATYEDAITALRAADEAGNTEDATRLAQIAQNLKPNPRLDRKEAAAVRQTPKPPAEEEPDLAGAAARTLGRVGHGEDSEGHGLAAGIGENALSAVTAVGGGLYGAARAAATAPFIGVDKAMEGGAKAAEDLTYKPRTQSGKDVATLLTQPITMAGNVIGGALDKAATYEARKLGEIGGMPASPETQMKFGAAGRTAGENVIPAALAVAPLPKAAEGLVRGRVPPAAGAADVAGALAQDKPVPGKDYSPLRTLTPEEEARYRQLKDYKPTLGQVQRNTAQMTFEEQEALRAGTKTGAAGKPTAIESTRSDLNEQLADQNKKLADNLRALSTKKGPTKPEDLGTLIQNSAETKRAANAKALSDDLNGMSGHPKADVSDSEVGTAIQRSAGTKLKASKADVKALYDDAKATEGAKKAPVKTLDDYFAENETEEINNTALSALHAKWNKIKPKPPAAPPAPPAILDASGKPMRPSSPAPATPPAQMTIGDLDQLYKAAGDAGDSTVPKTMRTANAVKEIIRNLQDQYGGPKYQAARAKRNQQGLEFEEQGGVSRAVAEATRTDMKVDASQLPNKILKGSVEDLKQTLNTLNRDIRPGSTATRAIDNTAVTGLRQKALNMLQDNPKSIPRENVEALFGKSAADSIYKKMADAEAKTKAETSHADKSIDPSLLPDKIIHGTVEDLKRTMATLNRTSRTGTETTRMADSSAVNGLKQHAINSILEEASGTVDAKGVPSIKPVQFRRALDKIGRDNLEVLFDKETAAKMYQLADDAEKLKVKPTRAGGSDTMSRAQVILDKDFTNRAAYLMENVARKFTGGMVMGSIRWAREAGANLLKSKHELENATEARHPTRASAAETAELAKPVNKELSQLRWANRKKMAPGPAAAALTMDKKKETASP